MSPLRPGRWGVLLAIGIMALEGCGSGTDTGGGGGGSIALEIQPATVSVEQGSSTGVTGRLVRTDFDGAVTIAVDSTPPGVAGTVDTSLAPGSAVISLAVDAATPVGSYTVRVRAAGAGVDPTVQSFTLNVIAPVAGSLTITGSAPVLVIPRGDNGTETLTITRDNFDAVANLSVDYLPNGITVVITPDQLAATDGTATLELAVADQVEPGVYLVLIRITSPNIGDKIFLVLLEVPDDEPQDSTVSLFLTMQGTGATQRAGDVHVYVGDAPVSRGTATIAAEFADCSFADPMLYTCVYDVPRGKTVTLIATNPARTGEDGYLSPFHPLPVAAADTVRDGSAFEFQRFDPPDCKTTNFGECVLLMDTDRAITAKFVGVHQLYIVMVGVGTYHATIDAARPQLAIPAETSNPDVGRDDNARGYIVVPSPLLISAGRFFSGTTVTYTTLPDQLIPGQENFIGWGDGTFCSNGGVSCSVTFNDTDFTPAVVWMRFRYWDCGNGSYNGHDLPPPVGPCTQVDP